MKNIHILPTDKPSRLYIDNKGKYNLEIGQVDFKTFKNIYITSDEEIKEGNWYASFIFDEKTKWTTTKLDCVVKANLNKTNEYLVEPFSKYCKKIILTTDQDLIADGVQAIDDEFLEWFVKNPSCESVEVIKDRVFRLDEFRQREFYDSYKIIIPKEEPKQETNKIMEQALKTINRKFDINWEKVQTLDDIKILLKGLQPQVYLYSETIPEHLKECFEKDLLIKQII